MEKKIKIGNSSTEVTLALCHSKRTVSSLQLRAIFFGFFKMNFDVSTLNNLFATEEECPKLLLGAFKTNHPYVFQFTPNHDYRVDGYKWRVGNRTHIKNSDIILTYYYIETRINGQRGQV